MKQELARQVGHKVEHKYVNLVGQTFGDLTVLARKDNTNWKCKCGKIIYRSTKTLYHGKHLHCEHNKLRYYDISCECIDIAHRGSKVENDIRDYIDRLISGD